MIPRSPAEESTRIRLFPTRAIPERDSVAGRVDGRRPATDQSAHAFGHCHHGIQEGITESEWAQSPSENSRASRERGIPSWRGADTCDVSGSTVFRHHFESPVSSLMLTDCLRYLRMVSTSSPISDSPIITSMAIAAFIQFSRPLLRFSWLYARLLATV